MANSKFNGAVTAANDLISIMQQMQTLRQHIRTFLDTYNSEQWNLLWNNFSTYTVLPDGNPPTPLTLDAAPNPAHPTAALHKSSTQLLGGVTLSQQFLNLCQNTAVITAQYSQTIDDLAGF